jgi:hypothetical protein
MTRALRLSMPLLLAAWLQTTHAAVTLRQPGGVDPAGSGFCKQYRCKLLSVKTAPDATYRQYQVGSGRVQLVVGSLPSGAFKGAVLAQMGAGALNGALMRDVYTRSFAVSFLEIAPGGSVLTVCGGGLMADARGSRLGSVSGMLAEGTFGKLACLATRAGAGVGLEMVHLVATRARGGARRAGAPVDETPRHASRD